MSVFASVMNASANAETCLLLQRRNDGSASLNPTDNTANIATVQRNNRWWQRTYLFNCKAGTNNNEEKRTYYLGALMITLEIPGKIPVHINFTTSEKATQENLWNNVTSHLAGTKIENLTDSEENTSGISKHHKVCRHYWKRCIRTTQETIRCSTCKCIFNRLLGKRCRKDGILADNAEIVFSGLNPENPMIFICSPLHTTEVHEAEYSTFGTVENYIGLNGNNNDQSVAELTSIYPDADGHIRFTVTLGLQVRISTK